jgi:hypothetical protein
MNSDANLCVPRITESFIDTVVASIGGRRLSESEIHTCAGQNADYLFHDAVAELKIFEEEGLEKKARQEKIAKALSERFILPPEVDLDLKTMDPDARPIVKELLREPIAKAVRKAAAQIKSTKRGLDLPLHSGVLIAVNNGYSSLQADEFENLVLTCLRRDTSQVDFALCVTVSHHAGAFDYYTFCRVQGHTNHAGLEIPHESAFRDAVGDLFNQRMTEMMQQVMTDQFSPEAHLSPVSGFNFEGAGVSFVRRAPGVPDSRFVKG